MRLRVFIFCFSILATLFFSTNEGLAVPTSGRVVEAGSGDPIEGAVVQVQASPVQTTTDASGEFVIDIPQQPFFILTAAKIGYVNNASFDSVLGATDVLIELPPVPTEANPEEPTFQSPMACASCHLVHYADWAGGGKERPSRHSTAGQNRWVRDLYDGSGTEGGEAGYVFKRDSPILSDEVNPTGLHRSGLCAECHLPSLAAVAEMPGTVELSDATAGSIEGTPERMAYEDGIFCGICHKIRDVNDNLGRTAFFGNIEPTLTDPGLQYGPLFDAVIDIAAQMRAAVNPLHKDSKVCAGCHQYNMDHDFDNDFEEVGSPPGQTTYAEWLSSPYAVVGEDFRSCQNCHMPPAEGEDDVVICVFGGPARSATALHSHRFEGTTLPYLQAAVELVIDASRIGDLLHAKVDVSNVGAGHNFPTGVSVRNAMLVVRAKTDSDTQLPHLEGTSLIPYWGGVGDEPDDYGDTPGRGFAKILRSHDDRERVLFIDAIELVENTQIPPMGTDTSEYWFDLSGLESEDLELSAEIIYRRAWKDLAEAKGWIGGVDGQGYPYEGDVLVKSVTVELTGEGPTPTPTAPIGCDSGYYLLDAFGGRHPVGSPPVITGSLYFGYNIARDLERARTGGPTSLLQHDLAVLDGAGAVHFIASPTQTIEQDFFFPITEEFPGGRAVDLSMTSDSLGYWVLTDFGGIYRAGSAKGEDESLVPNTDTLGLGLDIPLEGSLRDPSFPSPGGANLRAVSLLVIDEDGDSTAEGYVILDSMGGHHPFDNEGVVIDPGSSSGSEINSPDRLLDPTAYLWPFFTGLDIARDLELHPMGTGVVILDGWGGVHPVPVDEESNPVYFANNRVSNMDETPLSSVGLPYITSGFDNPSTEVDESDEETYGRDAASIFMDLEFTACESGLYTLDRFGGVFGLGAARENPDDPIPPFAGSPYFFPDQLAVDAEFFE
ncbi:MAG: carboxypeptidase-like regulatory domain-containing protein [Candidatus Omnitrophica bacterium]|nr:carboxypeptidase-like regulatory domain-containing protein [Candidatus Omnitrophota bacterium]